MQRLQPINVGQQANDRTGDPLRDGMVKVNENFTQVETAVDKVEAAAVGAQQRADAAHDKAVGAGAAAATVDGKAVAAAQSAAAGLAAAAAADGKAVAAQAVADEANRKAVAANAAAATAAQSAASGLAAASEADRKALAANAAAVVADGKAVAAAQAAAVAQAAADEADKKAQTKIPLSYAGIQSGVATLEGRLATLADAQIPHVTTATVWDDANWNELPKHARNDGLVMRLIRSGGSSQNGPPAGQYYYVRHHWFSDRDTLTQIAIPYYNSEEITPGFQYRMKYEGVWTRWYSADPQTKAKAFGVDQTLVNLAGQRLPGITYVNSTRKPISVYLYGGSTAAGGYINILMASIPVAVFQAQAPENGIAVNAIIPPGTTYFASAVNAKIEYWLEYR